MRALFVLRSREAQPARKKRIVTTAAKRVLFIRIPSSGQMKMALHYTKVARFVKGKKRIKSRIAAGPVFCYFRPKNGLREGMMSLASTGVKATLGLVLLLTPFLASCNRDDARKPGPQASGPTRLY